MDEISDEDLLLGFSKGKEGFFDTLFDRYNVPIYGYIRRTVLDEGYSQDIVQSLWERLIKNSTKIGDKIEAQDVEFHLKPYVFTMATNLINDHYRSPSIKIDSRTDSFEGIDKAEEFAPVDDQAMRTHHDLVIEELRLCVERRVCKVSAEMRQTYAITRDGGMTYGAAAEIFGVSVESIRSRVKNVLKVIKPCLEEFRND